MSGMEIDQITDIIIGAAIRIHREFGAGLLESAYEFCLVTLLRQDGLVVDRQVALPITFLGQRVEGAYKVDLLVEGKVVVEIKSVSRLEPVFFAQVLTYLKLTGCTVGLLINFNVSMLKDGGIRRVVRGYRAPSE